MMEVEFKERFEEELSRQMEFNLNSRPILIDDLKEKIGSIAIEVDFESTNYPVTSVDILRVVDSYPEVFGRYNDVVFLKSFERNFWIMVILDFCQENITSEIKYLDLFNYVYSKGSLLQTFDLEVNEVKLSPFINKYEFHDSTTEEVFNKVRRLLRKFVFIYPDFFKLGENSIYFEINDVLVTRIVTLIESQKEKVSEHKVIELYRKKFINDSISDISLIFHTFLAFQSINKNVQDLN